MASLSGLFSCPQRREVAPGRARSFSLGVFCPAMGEEPTGGDRRDRRRLTVPEAATVLGVTVDAARGRIRRGKLDSEHDKNGTIYARGMVRLSVGPTTNDSLYTGGVDPGRIVGRTGGAPGITQ